LSSSADLLMAPTFFDLSARMKFRVTGADSVRFLNGQITNDLRKATATSTIQASVLSAKGKLSGHAFISAAGDGAFLLDADSELRDELAARLIELGVADGSYFLYGMREECHCLDQKPLGRWVVFFGERGGHSSERVFEDEGDACAQLFKRLQRAGLVPDDALLL